jgi:hypothetical protein
MDFDFALAETPQAGAYATCAPNSLGEVYRCKLPVVAKRA